MSTANFKKALKSVWNYGETNSWPYKMINLPKSLLNDFYDDFGMALESASQRQEYKIGPTCFFRTFDILVKAMVYHNKSDNKKIVQNMMSLISNIKREDIFNESGRNLIYTQEYVNSYCNRAQNYTTEIGHKLIALLKSYVELLYFRSYDISQEIHGPYFPEQNRNTVLLVWSYINLRPVEIISEAYILPYKEIKFEMLYTDDVNMRFDIYNHVYQEGSNLKDNLLSCSILIDDRPATLTELNELEQMLISKIRLLYTERKNLTDEDFIKLYSKNLWYKLNLISDEVIYKMESSPLNMNQDIISVSAKTPDYRILDLYF